MTMQPCTEDSDCPNPVRSTCAATFLNQLYAKQTATLHSDHLYCLQRDCVKGGSSCGPGQSCLPKLVDAGGAPARHLRPQLRRAGSLPAQPLLLPQAVRLRQPAHLPPRPARLPVRVGHRLHGRQVHERRRARRRRAPQPVHRPVRQRRRLREVRQRPGQVRLQPMARPRPLRDARRLPRRALLQRRRLHARRGNELRVLEPPTTPTDQGTCSRPCCPADGACTPRGGFGHVCLPFTVARDGDSKPGCYPGYFGLPCTGRRQLRRRPALPRSGDAPPEDLHGALPDRRRLRATTTGSPATHSSARARSARPAFAMTPRPPPAGASRRPADRWRRP